MNIFKLRLSIGLLLLSLIIWILASLSFQAVEDFYTYKKAINKKLDLTLDRFHFFLKERIQREWMKLTAPPVPKDSDSPLKTFRITINPQDLDSLNANLPTSGKDHFVKAYMTVSDKKDKIYKIKLRYRGDSNYHWAYRQKSLRIKLNKDDLYDMAKKFNLINPPSQLSYRDSINYNLSKKLGLISPQYIPSRVYINGKYMGVYIYLSQIDESLLREHRLMPGSIYFGDGSPIDKDGVASLWSSASYWQKKAARNAEQKNNREDIELFIKSVNSDPHTFNSFVETYLNKEKFFTFIALDRVFGSHHHDYIHNHKIYFDPYKGKFEPISWDLRFWLSIPQKDLSLYPLQLQLAHNPVYDAQIDKIAYRIITDNLLSNVENSYSQIIHTIEADLKSDIYKDNAVRIPQISPKPISQVLHFQDVIQDKKESIKALKTRVAYLTQLYNNTALSYDIQTISKDKKRLTIVIEGDSPALMHISDRLKTALFHKQNSVKDGTLLYSGREIVPNSQNLFSIKFYGTKTVHTKPVKYNFTLYSNLPDEEILSQITFTNYITNKPIKPKKLTNTIGLDKISVGTISSTKSQTETLQGEIHVTKTLEFDKDTTVIIKPGTTFIISPKTSLYFYGKVVAKGTKANPISFKALNPKEPWGIVAVQGKATTGSIFEYCHFENGSIDIHHLIHYTAPFNIHNMDNFRVEHCTIGRNYLGDDAMHIAYAKGVVDSCEFRDARSDGLDIDISNVTVTNNTFEHIGNDGLDVMTTTMVVSNNTFIDTGDKGISVGEWSDVNISDSTFIKTAIGLEIKDKSHVRASNLTFIDAKIKAINLYNKNKRYDKGGFLKATNIHLIGNKIITADKKSRYIIDDKN